MPFGLLYAFAIFPLIVVYEFHHHCSSNVVVAIVVVTVFWHSMLLFRVFTVISHS